MTYVLVDCNNFYVSCERLFRPELETRPVVVLSNNDGCIISRSKEAKAMGIKMAIPYFQVREYVERGDLHVFSSNYALYGDLSARVMNILEEQAPSVEVYSIDEAFLNLTGVEHCQNLTQFGQVLKERVLKWSGIPVCVGIAATKTLAKLANHAAKAYPQTQGVVDLEQPGWRQRLLAKTPISEIWGVGRSLSVRLQEEGIATAADLAASDPETMRSRYSAVLEQTILELRGIPCFSFDEEPKPKQQVLCSRTFNQRITQLQPLQEAVREYAVRAAEKLRQEQQLSRHISVHIRTNPNSRFDARYSNTASIQLLTATNDTRVIIKTVMDLLVRIYRDGYRYMKASVILNELQPENAYQRDLFSTSLQTEKGQRLMQALDAVNQRFPRGVIFAGQGCEQTWAMQRNYLSPAYTTHWDALKRVGALRCERLL